MSCDVWGPSPYVSNNGFCYYVIFVDHIYSRSTWLYPIASKNEVFYEFLHFKRRVENHFSTSIKYFQSDWGGEYRRLSQLLDTCEISHRVSCPHTHQQNGMVERKHRHIINEAALALLIHASPPFRF